MRTKVCSLNEQENLLLERELLLHQVKKIRFSKMKYYCVIICFLFLFFTIETFGQNHAVPQIRTTPKYLSPIEIQSVKLYKQVIPAVVTIFTSQRVIQKEGPQVRKAIGSGVLISSECHVLTAAHVIAGMDEIMIKTHDGKTRPAELLFSETGADIALVKFKIPEPNLPHAELGDSDILAIGQTTFAIGSPYGLEGSFSAGIISVFRDFDRLYDGTIKAEFI